MVQYAASDIALGVSLLSAATYSLVSGVIVTPASQVFLAIVCGLMLGTYQRAAGLVSFQASWKTSSLLVIAIILLLMRFFVVLFPEVLHLDRDEFVWIVTHSQDGRASLQPRFWQQGWIIQP